jgi:hypothetical protein
VPVCSGHSKYRKSYSIVCHISLVCKECSPSFFLDSFTL